MAFPHRDHGRPRHRAPPHHRDHGTGQIRRPPTLREQAQGIRAHGHHPFQSVALPARLHHPMVRAAPPRPETQHLVQPRQAVQHHCRHHRGSAARRAHARTRAPHDGQARPNPRAAHRARIPRDTQTALDDAELEELIDRNPCRRVKPPRYEETPQRILDESQPKELSQRPSRHPWPEAGEARTTPRRTPRCGPSCSNSRSPQA